MEFCGPASSGSFPPFFPARPKGSIPSPLLKCGLVDSADCGYFYRSCRRYLIALQPAWGQPAFLESPPLDTLSSLDTSYHVLHLNPFFRSPAPQQSLRFLPLSWSHRDPPLVKVPLGFFFARTAGPDLPSLQEIYPPIFPRERLIPLRSKSSPGLHILLTSSLAGQFALASIPAFSPH